MKNILIFTILLLATISNINGQGPTVTGVNFINYNATASLTVNDKAIYNILSKMAHGQLEKDDIHLVDLIKKSVRDSVLASGEFTNPKAFFQAGAKKAQVLVSDVTAAYTQAIFKAKTAVEARRLLARYQETIKMIVEFTKEGKFGL